MRGPGADFVALEAQARRLGGDDGSVEQAIELSRQFARSYAGILAHITAG